MKNGIRLGLLAAISMLLTNCYSLPRGQELSKEERIIERQLTESPRKKKKRKKMYSSRSKNKSKKYRKSAHNNRKIFDSMRPTRKLKKRRVKRRKSNEDSFALYDRLDKTDRKILGKSNLRRTRNMFATD